MSKISFFTEARVPMPTFYISVASLSKVWHVMLAQSLCSKIGDLVLKDGRTLFSIVNWFGRLGDYSIRKPVNCLEVKQANRRRTCNAADVLSTAKYKVIVRSTRQPGAFSQEKNHKNGFIKHKPGFRSQTDLETNLFVL